MKRSVLNIEPVDPSVFVLFFIFFSPHIWRERALFKKFLTFSPSPTVLLLPMSTISIESFIAGFAYGGTTVLVGQPLETLKTLTQVPQSQSSSQKQSLIDTATSLYKQGGIKSFYRGGVPLLLGGGLMRSAQFGCYNR